jgi:polyhydroxyalkanoate synthesis regulator phasin
MSRSFFSLKRGLAASGAVLVLGGSAIGIASAQTAPTATPSTVAQAGQAHFQAFVDALAKRLGISSATLQTAIGQARTDAGLPAGGGFGPGRGGARGPGGPGGGQDLSAAATVIGIPVTQLQQELATKSLADVATAHGKAAADVATALKNAAHTRIDQAVTDGKLTAAEATTQKTAVDQRIDQQMTQVRPQGGGPGGPGGFGRNLDAAAQAIGIPVTQLQQELPGKTLTAVATAHGKNPADVATALKTAANTRIDQAVTAGRLTADQAATQKQQVSQRIDQQMTEVMPQAPAGA